MYTLSEKSKRNISSVVGLPFDKIIEKNSTEIDILIEKKINKKLEHTPSDIFKTSGRGTPFLYLWRLLDIKTINNRLAKI